MKRIIVLLLFSVSLFIFPQQFRTGVYSALEPTNQPQQNLQQIHDMNSNSVVNHTNSYNKTDLENLFDSVIVFNFHDESHYIHHYTAGYYSKWEAEENLDINANTPGIKHQFGSISGGTWKSGTNPADIDKYLITGPDYIQDRLYRLWYREHYQIPYTLKFRMKIDGSLTQGVPVCEISVAYRTEEGEIGIIMQPEILYADNLSNSFADYTFTYRIPEFINNSPTEYPERGISGFSKTPELPGQSLYQGAYGVQFNIKWLGNRNLYVDYIEVYDQDIWGAYKSRPDSVRDLILNYADAAGTSNTMNFYSLDEPWTLDNYIPYIVVDSILTNNGKPSLITNFHPQYTHKRNNEFTLKRFVETVQPKKLMYNLFPYDYRFSDPVCLEVQRAFMQKPFDEGFAVEDYYFATQAFGYTPYCSTDNYNARKPNRAQLRATTMLALAHGAKGIFYWNYYSYFTSASNCGTVQLIDAIVDANYQPTDLYYEIKDNIFHRLSGTLGNTLVKLNYTGNYISFSGGSSDGMIHTQDYLSIWQGTQQVSYHAGLLEDKLTDFNKYFLVMNKLTDADRYCQLYINYDQVLTGYINWRVKNVEGGFDTSFSSNNYVHFYDSLKAGEGKLFQVAPVVKYGGSLIANETISTPQVLTDELTIENGATLTINNSYNVYADITVKSGGKILCGTNSNSQIVFHGEAKLILEGNAELSGTSSNKMKIDFLSPASGRTIYVKHNATAKIHACIIKNAYAGISIDDDVDDLEIVNNTFENCTFGIKLEQNTLASPYIFNNTFIGCSRGIFALALNTINIGKNIISADVPIWLENTAYPIITWNTLSPSEPSNGAGIYLSSCSGGMVRKNNINDFYNGIFLNQSSPKLFDNKITGSSYEGIYIGAGSNPVLKPGFASQGESTYLIDDAGFNFVYENGNSLTDGTEITIYNASPVFDYGDNKIVDDRETTSLLIDGSREGNTRDFYARNNYWGMNGEDPGRRFGFDVIYDPIITQCQVT